MAKRDDVNGALMREMEALSRSIGGIIGKAINEHTALGGPKRGFMLMMFSFDGPECTYISNASREDMLKAMEEFIARQRGGEGMPTWDKRS